MLGMKFRVQGVGHRIKKKDSSQRHLKTCAIQNTKMKFKPDARTKIYLIFLKKNRKKSASQQPATSQDFLGVTLLTRLTRCPDTRQTRCLTRQTKCPAFCLGLCCRAYSKINGSTC